MPTLWSDPPDYTNTTTNQIHQYPTIATTSCCSHQVDSPVTVCPEEYSEELLDDEYEIMYSKQISKVRLIPRLRLSFLIPFLFLFLPVCHGLVCMTCLQSPGTTQLDAFRVSTKLSRPSCPMEPIRCDRDQDVCVTITMHIGNGEYWLGAGCDRRVNFQHMSCQNIKTVSRNVQSGYVQERRAMQRVCVCTRDLCNSSSVPPPTSLYTTLVFLLFLLLIHLR